VRLFAPFNRLNSISRGGLALAGILLTAPPAWSQSPAEVEALRSRAVKGDADAQNRLGNLYISGAPGVSADATQALNWFQQAASRGFAPAQYNLGLAYELGRGVAVDERQAFKYYLMAAEQGFVAAQFNVGNMYTEGRGVAQDYFEANLWFKQAADSGLPEAQFTLGLAYELGRGMKKDEAQAARWYRQAADRGYARAQYNLGLLYEDGRGVAKDPAAAATFYRASAQQGFAPAQVNYGLALTEGRAGAAPDPVQGFVWLSRAVQNGAKPQARDALAAELTVEQLAAANRILAGLAPNPGDARAVATVAPPTAPAAAATRDDNKLVDQLRDQSRRLAAQVETLTSEKADHEREAAVLTAQVRDLQEELGKLRAGAPAATAPAVDVSRYESQVADLKTQLAEATASLQKQQAAVAQLTETNQRLQQEKTSAATPRSGSEAGKPLDAGAQASILANLQRDNARLNDEVKRSTRELLALNQQLRALRAQPAGSIPVAPAANTEEIAQLTAKVQQAAADLERVQGENRQLIARIGVLEALPKPTVDATAGKDLAEARQESEDLRKKNAALQNEKIEAEKWARSLESNLNEISATAKVAETRQADLLQRLGQAQGQVKEREDDLAAQKETNAQLAEANKTLDRRLAQTQKDLQAATTRKGDTAEVDRLRRQLEESGAQVAALDQQGKATAQQLTTALEEGRAVQARVAQLEQDLATARTGAGEAQAALAKTSATVAELTASNESLQRDLAAAKTGGSEATAVRDELARARRDLVEMATLREENIRLRQAAAAVDELKAKNAQLIRDSEQMNAFLNSNRSDLDQAQAHAAELEKQLAEATTVRTEGGQGMRKLQADLTEANGTVDKLNNTVAELTAANEKLEKDLDSAQKSTAAALAAQSQAVSAASPDSYQMEIGTLNARIKQLESQVEDERASAAREVSTLAGQLQRTRETNKSLADANRALVAAKDSDTSATRDELDQLQNRVKELTAANDDLRRQGQQAAASVRTLTGERDDLKSQLVDARKIATTLPGLADERAALQERLEAVGTQLMQSQRDEEELQKANADLTKQLALSQEATEKAQADLAAMQGKVADAEKAADSHTTSVADLTAANARLELEKGDMRRLVESYRADIARLNQSVRASEQQRAEGERSGQQNIDALTAQMAQLRRELEAARGNQTRLTESYAAQERDRSATITQLRTENAALAARLNQAQGTLDQIAAAARLGTPAASIASGTPIPVVRTAPVAPAADARVHTVAEGDSLSRISMRYYGTPNRWQEIFQANRDVLQGSSTLRVGMQLRIP
jgi:TPR repeat protein/chromosome segregation ATPase